MVLEEGGGAGVGRPAGREHDEGLDPLAALFAGRADHRAFLHRRMGVERILHLGRGDIVARRDDHVVGAGEVPEIAVLVLAVGVAGDVPAVDDIIGLPLVVEIAAAGRALDREPAGAVRHRPVVLVENRRDIAGHGLAGRAGADVLARGGDEDVHHLGRADAVDDGEAGRVLPGMPGRGRQMLAGRDAGARGSKCHGRRASGSSPCRRWARWRGW